MDVRTQSALLAAIICSALGLSMVLRAARPKVLTLYSIFAFTVGGYYLAQFFHSLFQPAPSYPWLSRISLGGTIVLGSLIPSAALNFLLERFSVRPQVVKLGRRLAYFSALLGAAVGLSPLAENVWARAGVSIWVIGSLLASVWLLVSRARSTESRIERARLMYLAIGAGASVLFSVFDELGRFDLPFPGVGALVSTLYMFFLAQMLLRLRLLDLHELFGKVASQTVLAACLAMVFASLTVWWVEKTGLFLFNTVVAAFVMLILLEPLRAKLEEQVVAVFFRERHELLQGLAQLRARIANIIDEKELFRVVLDGLYETRRVTHASIFLLGEHRPGYLLQAHRGPAPSEVLDPTAARGLLAAASSGQKAVLLEHLERRFLETRQNLTEGKKARDELRRLQEIRSAMGQMKAGMTIPLSSNDQVIGFLNLWDERVPEAFASDEIAALLELGEHIATVIENSKLYEKMREKDRLAALGEMSAGLAHEIRNPLGAIKGAAQCLDPSSLPGEDGEFLEVIVEEVNRLNGVVTAFLDYARPMKQSFGPTDINEVVNRTARLIQNDLPAQVQLKVSPASDLPKVSADAEQLKQVLINLIQNAVQAMGERGGEISLRTMKVDRFTEVRAGKELIEVCVTDTGPGIPPDQKEHLFVPFYTTKEKGTGLGLAICHRIVKNHGGHISVESEPGHGCTFSIRLPAEGAQANLEGSAPEPGSVLLRAGAVPPWMNPSAQDEDKALVPMPRPEQPSQPSRPKKRRRKAS